MVANGRPVTVEWPWQGWVWLSTELACVPAGTQVCVARVGGTSLFPHRGPQVRWESPGVSDPYLKRFGNHQGMGLAEWEAPALFTGSSSR